MTDAAALRARKIQLLMAGLLLFFLWTGETFAQQQLMAGASVRNITPDPLLPVSGGIGTPKPAQEKRGDLFVRAMVLVKGDVKIAIVGIDNLGWPSVLGDKARALIDHIPAENVLIGATHTHSAPDAYGFPDEEGNHHADLSYLEFCTQQIAEAVNEAYSRLQPADLKIAMGEAKGKIAFNYYAEDLYDPRCGVIQAIAKGTDQTIATLVNYAIHPEVMGSKRGVLSPDLCGPLYERIESQAGGVAIFMNGALGGMVTADNRHETIKSSDGVPNDLMWSECVRIGNLLADEALRIVSQAKPLLNPQLQSVSKMVDFPVDSPIMQYILANSPLGYISANPTQVSTRVNALQIGPARILTIPREALPNVRYYLKRNMDTQFPFLFGLTNDAFGYMMAKVVYDSFRKYDYITRTSLGEMTAENYMKEALELVGKLRVEVGMEE